MSALRPELVRANSIRRQRETAARTGVVATVIQTQLMFWCWVIGWVAGPAPLVFRELAIAAAVVFALGGLLAWFFVRRRIEWGVTLVAKLREGSKKYRVAVFDEYLTIGEEIVLRQSIDSTRMEGSNLHIGYTRAADGRHHVRTFSGLPRVLSRMMSELGRDFANA